MSRVIKQAHRVTADEDPQGGVNRVCVNRVCVGPDPRGVMNYQQHQANSAAIRSEIHRFESVHPNIYSIYELLERVEEPQLQNQIREHVIAIEGRCW